jgi:hypothetical protein
LAVALVLGSSIFGCNLSSGCIDKGLIENDGVAVSVEGSSAVVDSDRVGVGAADSFVIEH